MLPSRLIIPLFAFHFLHNSRPTCDRHRDYHSLTLRPHHQKNNRTQKMHNRKNSISIIEPMSLTAESPSPTEQTSKAKRVPSLNGVVLHGYPDNLMSTEAYDQLEESVSSDASLIGCYNGANSQPPSQRGTPAHSGHNSRTSVDLSIHSRNTSRASIASSLFVDSTPPSQVTTPSHSVHQSRTSVDLSVHSHGPSRSIANELSSLDESSTAASTPSHHMLVSSTPPSAATSPNHRFTSTYASM